jgi:C4-type Zn-finger protein
MQKKGKMGRPFICNIDGILGRADFEIERLKKMDESSYKKAFRYDEFNNAARKVTTGFQDNYHLSYRVIGSVEEWEEAFKYFCKQTVNTKGQKVNRRKLLNENFSFGCGRVK